MCIPLGDDNSDRSTFPYVTYALIAINVFVWIVLQGMSGESPFTIGYSTIPFELTHNTDLVGREVINAGGESIPFQQFPGPTPIYLTLLTSMFMHASWMHIGGNMLYLWIFGDNVEDLMGHAKFAVFYLLCGLAASFAQIFFTWDSHIPGLGASGAIAGVLGAYLVKFPKKSIRVIALRFLTELPAYIVLGMWILMQIFSQVSVAGAGQESGVAYMAHIGGFAAGVALVFLFAAGRKSATFAQ